MKLLMGIRCHIPLDDRGGGEFPCLFNLPITYSGWALKQASENPSSFYLVMFWAAVSFNKVSNTVQKSFLLACLRMLRGVWWSQVCCRFSWGHRCVDRIVAGCCAEGWGRRSVGEEAVALWTCIYRWIFC